MLVPSIPPQPQSRLFMNFFKDIFSAPDTASPQQVKAAFQKSNVVVIDVRSPGEISTKVNAKNWINAPGTPFHCPDLEQGGSAKLIPDKTTPVIVYCASGKRSQKACNILKEQGYNNVWNAGGIGQIDYLPIKSVE